MTTLDGAIERLAADRRRGSAQLARTSAGILARAARAGLAEPQLRATARSIAVAQPSMAAVANTAAGFVEGIATPVATAVRLQRYWREAPAALAARHAARFGGVVLTHSWSSDVMRTLEAARPALVVLTESRPGLEGIAAASRLRRVGIAVRLVADAAAGHFARGVDCVALGADSVLPGGGIINKVGSYPIAVAAVDLGKPVYVLAETMKVSPVVEPILGDASTPSRGARVESPLFEVVPPHLVSAILVEDGTLDGPALAALVARFGDARAALGLTP